MKIRRLIVITVLLTFYVNFNLKAWDENREGFILGLGIGTSYLSFDEYDTCKKYYNGEGTKIKETISSKFNLATNFRLGYSFSNKFMLYWFSKGSFFLDNVIDIWMLANAGIGTSYYFSDSAKSFFITGGIGYNNIAIFKLGKNFVTFGFTIGGGYEYDKHFDVELDFLFGADNDEWKKVYGFKRKYGTRYSIMLTLNWTGY